MQHLKLGEFVRSKRKNLSISLNNFAIECEIEPATLSNFETGKSDILLENFLKIIKGFNQTPIEFFKEYNKIN